MNKLYIKKQDVVIDDNEEKFIRYLDNVENAAEYELASDFKMLIPQVHQIIENLADKELIAVDKQGYISLTEKAKSVSSEINNPTSKKYYISGAE